MAGRRLLSKLAISGYRHEKQSYRASCFLAIGTIVAVLIPSRVLGQSGPTISSRIVISGGQQYPAPYSRPVQETAVAFSNLDFDNRLVAV